MQYPIKPMLAEKATAPTSTIWPHPFGREDWYFEPKLDGVRTIAHVDGMAVRLQSRQGNDVTSQYPELVAPLQAIPNHDFILDGEIVMMGDDLTTDFNDLQNHRTGDRSRLRFVAFDVLEIDGERVTGKPLRQRKFILSALFDGSIPPLMPVPTFRDGRDLWRVALERQWEGVIAKPVESRYIPDNRGIWLKFKRNVIEDFLIVGYTEGTGHRSGTIGALVLAREEGKRLVYAGKCGTGFPTKTLAYLLPRLQERRQAEPSVDKAQAVRIKVNLNGKAITWIRPELKARVEFNDYASKERVVRMGAFKGLSNG